MFSKFIIPSQLGLKQRFADFQYFLYRVHPRFGILAGSIPGSGAPAVKLASCSRCMLVL